MNDKTRTPLPSPSDWTFELIEQYHGEIARVARGYKLDTYPNQLEIITAEQMMDAYASVGMPVLTIGAGTFDYALARIAVAAPIMKVASAGRRKTLTPGRKSNRMR